MIIAYWDNVDLSYRTGFHPRNSRHDRQTSHVSYSGNRFCRERVEKENGVLELWIKFHCSPLLCDNQGLGMSYSQ